MGDPGHRWTSIRPLVSGVAVASLVAISAAFVDFTLILGLLLGPAVAAAFGRPVPTGITAGYAVVVAVVLVSMDDSGWRGEDVARVILLVVGSVLVTGIAWLQARREADIHEVELVAERAQLALLRPLPPVLDHTALAVRYVSASSKAIVGGDLYEAAYTPHGVRLVIGDARGKGLEGVEMAAHVLGAFRELAYSVPTLSQLARMLDGAVARHAQREDFVTAVLVEIRAQRVSIANCGHPPPLHCAQRAIRPLEATPAVPLGLGSRPSPMSFGTLEWGERLLLYTDGLLEARDRQGRLFDVEEAARLALFEEDMGRGLDQLLERVQEHTGGPLQDDIAVLLLEMVQSDLPAVVGDPVPTE